jgi:CheY-like chemotaxis protein
VAWSVMVVDDEPMTRALLQLMLAAADCEVVEAEDGLDALEKINENLPDLVVLDVMMPRMDGLSLCYLLRQNPKTAVLPIILLSAKTSPEAVQEGLLAGANKYLTKPIARRDLVQSIEELMAEAVNRIP